MYTKVSDKMEYANGADPDQTEIYISTKSIDMYIFGHPCFLGLSSTAI